MPHFYKGYDKDLDLTEEEYWEQQAENYGDEDYYVPTWAEIEAEYEGEPYEDSYFFGIPDYDIFGRPSWET